MVWLVNVSSLFLVVTKIGLNLILTKKCCQICGFCGIVGLL
jgi:hypothetical protein